MSVRTSSVTYTRGKMQTHGAHCHLLVVADADDGSHQRLLGELFVFPVASCSFCFFFFGHHFDCCNVDQEFDKTLFAST